MEDVSQHSGWADFILRCSHDPRQDQRNQEGVRGDSLFFLRGLNVRRILLPLVPGKPLPHSSGKVISWSGQSDLRRASVQCRSVLPFVCLSVW
jgi:hypothetical protein